jgi:hypothetical protein
MEPEPTKQGKSQLSTFQLYLKKDTSKTAKMEPREFALLSFQVYSVRFQD